MTIWSLCAVCTMAVCTIVAAVSNFVTFKKREHNRREIEKIKKDIEALKER